MFWEAIFLSTGVFQTIGCQWLYYQGAAHSFSFLTVAATYFGMMLVYFLPTETEKKNYEALTLKPFPTKAIFVISLFDFVGNLCTTVGLFLIGSGVKNLLTN